MIDGIFNKICSIFSMIMLIAKMILLPSETEEIPAIAGSTFFRTHNLLTNGTNPFSDKIGRGFLG